MRPAAALLEGPLTIDDLPLGGGEDDGNVVPLARATEAGSRSRHPAGRHVAPPAGGAGDVAPAGIVLEDGLPSERSIATGLVEGRRWALAAAYERWVDLVHGIARQYVGRDSADDVAQQVFIEAWRARRSFSPERGEVPGWLVGITRNMARAHLRARGPATLDVDERRDGDATSPGADVVVDSLLVASAFRDLPAPQRAVLELTLVGEYTQTEAAARLDIPLGTVKTRHRRGLETLRASLEEALT